MPGPVCRKFNIAAAVLVGALNLGVSEGVEPGTGRYWAVGAAQRGADRAHVGDVEELGPPTPAQDTVISAGGSIAGRPRAAAAAAAAEGGAGAHGAAVWSWGSTRGHSAAVWHGGQVLTASDGAPAMAEQRPAKRQKEGEAAAAQALLAWIEQEAADSTVTALRASGMREIGGVFTQPAAGDAFDETAAIPYTAPPAGPEFTNRQLSGLRAAAALAPRQARFAGFWSGFGGGWSCTPAQCSRRCGSRVLPVAGPFIDS